MLKQTEGSQAVAEAVALCRPEAICAYPISPQTHIVEALGERVKRGDLQPCEFINVESEFAAMSVAIGASAAGARRRRRSDGRQHLSFAAFTPISPFVHCINSSRRLVGKKEEDGRSFSDRSSAGTPLT